MTTLTRVYSYNFRELKILGLQLGIVVASIVLNEWVWCNCVVIDIIIVHHVRVFEDHAIATATKQILITHATWLLDHMWRVMRNGCASVVRWHSFFRIIGERSRTCLHGWLMEAFSKSKLVEEREALVELTLELFLRQREHSKLLNLNDLLATRRPIIGIYLWLTLYIP